MKKLSLLIALLFLFHFFLVEFAYSIDENELPYGVYYNMGWGNTQPLYDEIDSLGFNFIIDKMQADTVIYEFAKRGMQYIFDGEHQDGSDSREDWHQYSHASYGLWEGESTYSNSSRYILLHHPTSSGGDLQWLCPVDEDVYSGDVQEWCEDCEVGSGADSIYYICNDDTSGSPQLVMCGPKPPLLERNPGYLRNPDDNIHIDFVLKAETDEDTTNNDDDVCYLDVGIFDKWGTNANFIRLDSAYLDESTFLDSSGSLTWRLDLNFTQDEIPDSMLENQSFYVASHVVSAANRKLYVDKVAVYDDAGKLVCDRHNPTLTLIKNSLDNSWARPSDTTGLAYYFMGEPYYYQFRIFNVIDSLIDESTEGKMFYYTEFIRLYEDIDFFHFANPEILSTYYYKLTAVDMNFHESNPTNEVSTNPTGFNDDPHRNIPRGISMLTNHPNPFNSATFILYEINCDGYELVDLSIYNVMGQKVKTIVDKLQTSGSYDFIWEAKDDAGRRVSSGTYFLILRKGGDVKRTKMVLLK